MALLKPSLEQVAEGVWRFAGDLRQAMNVYFIEEDGGVLQFDAGTSRMTEQVREAAHGLGGLRRIVLGHSHPDHRGTAPGLGVPVLCHPDEVKDAEGDGGIHYFDFERIPWWFSRLIYPRLLRHWDGGPVKISDAVSEGDEIAGFEVLHFPGHAPGLIGLWRERDRLALVSDVLYMVDSIRLRPLPDERAPMVPHPVWALDYQASIESARKLAALEPRTVCVGHDDPLVGEPQQLRARIELAAERASALAAA
jgi:hydroxyacylglutathione hydrolase